MSRERGEVPRPRSCRRRGWWFDGPQLKVKPLGVPGVRRRGSNLATAGTSVWRGSDVLAAQMQCCSDRAGVTSASVTLWNMGRCLIEAEARNGSRVALLIAPGILRMASWPRKLGDGEPSHASSIGLTTWLSPRVVGAAMAAVRLLLHSRAVGAKFPGWNELPRSSRASPMRTRRTTTTTLACRATNG